MRILHILRAPIGGLFRHVCDLVQVQASLGHCVGIVCDSDGGGDRARHILADLEQCCGMGVHRIAMPRLPGSGDIHPIRRVNEIARSASPDIVHGHGAKGGLYARLTANKAKAQAIYTPHGGALHYSWSTPQGAIFLGAEKLLLRKTAGLCFVCRYERDTFERKIGLGKLPTTVVHNGLWPHEFEPVQPSADATDLLYVGELRHLKGVDLLIDAVARVNRQEPVSLTIVGDGPDRNAFEQQVASLHLTDRVHFTGAMPAREAFSLGRIIVVPSRAESFPYIVLESIAAGLPIVATRVGGIPEILPDNMLVTPNDFNALHSIIKLATEDPSALVAAAQTQAEIASKDLSVNKMGTEILGFYEAVRELNPATK